MIDPAAHAKTLTASADIVSLGALLGVWLGLLPYLAAGVAMVWYVLQIYESSTVQGWLRRREQRRQSQPRVVKHLVDERERHRPHHTHPPREDF